ncbi:MAG: MBL fold metallo-hydrolase [Burkholderiaceae bacterium]|nr:MBL fold metallo-hydrolase [Burkholderiaceae bacterium]MEB2317296.1 MBL fold metallo-hydrolase [Pseudomonadota bacterium]
MSEAGALPPGVRFIERDWLSANHILLVDPDSTTMVDTGFVKHAPMTLALVEAALASDPPPSRRIGRIINTHLHSDHCGGNAAVRERHGCRITVPVASFASARDWNIDALTYRYTGQPCPRFPVDDALAPGEDFHAGGLRWVAHAAPGHDPESLVLFAPEAGLLISADALWANGFGILFPELQGESGFTEQRAVLGLIESLAPRRILPGHGPMFDDVAAAIERARGRLESMAADPQRHARHAMKVMIKYRLLYMESETIAGMRAELAGAGFLTDVARWIGMDTDAAIDWAVDALVESGQAVRDGERIANRG